VHAHPHPVLSSGALKSLAESDALIELAAAQSSFERDTLLPAYPLNLAFA
jgi:molybdopterin biosynthesis enzyme